MKPDEYNEFSRWAGYALDRNYEDLAGKSIVNTISKKAQDAMKKGEPFDAVILDLTIPGGMGGKEYVNAGDRVLVLKYLYRFREPEPWDVVVFRNPQDNRQNYIKRLIGLAGETIEIVHGDIFYKGYRAPWFNVYPGNRKC